MKRGKLVGLIADRQPIACDQLILAVGHSARDTFEMLMAAPDSYGRQGFFGRCAD